MINHKFKIIIFLFLVIFLTGCMRESEVSFCRNTFMGILKGDLGVQKRIGWENFQALGINVGETYNSLADFKERLEYRQAFIKNMRLGFRRAGGNYHSFVNWRIYARDSQKVIVASDYTRVNKTIYLTITNQARPKLISIQWEAGNE